MDTRSAALVPSAAPAGSARPFRVALNGFGRIGRAFVRAYRHRYPRRIELVAINDTADPETLAHLFAYDSRYGRWPEGVRPELGGLVIGGEKFELLRQADPAGLPWGLLDIDLVIDATGRHRTRQRADRHRLAGASRVVVSAPMPDADGTLIHGINHVGYDPVEHRVLSAGSCTGHALLPLLTVLDTEFGWERGYFTTVHPTTGDQSTVDAPHADLRRGRSALGGGIIPTTSSAVGVVRQVLPRVGATLDGMAYRIPSPHPAAIDLVAQVHRETTREAVLAAFSAASERLAPGVLGVEEEPLVGADYTGDAHSATVDASCVSVTAERQIHVTAWYDNETAYAHRLLDLAVFLATREGARVRLAEPERGATR